MSTNDGGPAFPVLELNDQGVLELTHPGMSLRAYFAAKALPVVYAEFWENARAGEFSIPEGWADGIATGCFSIADAMIAAMERKA